MKTETKTRLVHFAETKYGFDYGAAKIERVASDDDKGWVIVGIETPKVTYMQIYVTKTGKVRIFDSRGEWTAPAKPTED